MDPLDLFDRGTAWVKTKIPAAESKLDRSSPCDEWTVRALLNHMLDAQRRFAGAASGTPAGPFTGMPPDVLGDDPLAQYEAARQSTLRAYRAPGALERAGPQLGIAFVDQLVHGWDLARATGQDPTMPSDLADAAFAMVDGRLTDDRRGTNFKPAVPVPDDAPVQDRLIGYSGREP
jgi:uncharacterized protein (TIGR03086 family)